MVEGGRSGVAEQGSGVVEGEGVVVRAFESAAEAPERGMGIGWNGRDVTSTFRRSLVMVAERQVCAVECWRLT